VNCSHSRCVYSARPDVLRSRPGFLFTLDCLEIIGPSKNVLLLFLELREFLEIKATMKTKTVISLMIVGLMLIVIADERAVSATPQQKSSVRKEVKVYFYHDPGEYIDLSPVTRLVSATSPARGSIDALLKGPTARERQLGFNSLVSASDFRIGSLSIKDGTAKINFVSRRSWHGWPGDLGPVRFKTAVELILKQFSTVQNVIVSLNGNPNFAAES